MAGERLRRSRDEVQALIVAAARALFAERGYAGATTREIAERAGTSEVLIFRYFGNKAGLFEEAVFAPFDRLIGEFKRIAVVEVYRQRCRARVMDQGVDVDLRTFAVIVDIFEDVLELVDCIEALSLAAGLGAAGLADRRQ